MKESKHTTHPQLIQCHSHEHRTAPFRPLLENVQFQKTAVTEFTLAVMSQTWRDAHMHPFSLQWFSTAKWLWIMTNIITVKKFNTNKCRIHLDVINTFKGLMSGNIVKVSRYAPVVHTYGIMRWVCSVCVCDVTRTNLFTYTHLIGLH